MRDEYTELEIVLVLVAIEQQPGIWTCAVCRHLNRRPETEESVIHCGFCEHYANPRKRKRAASLPEEPLEGFPDSYKLHPPCPFLSLRQVQYRLQVLEDAQMIHSDADSVIPDGRNLRGWDFATRWFPNGWREGQPLYRPYQKSAEDPADPISLCIQLGLGINEDGGGAINPAEEEGE